MLYAIAFLFPPLAVLIVRPLQLPVNILFCLLLWIPGIIHAFSCVSDARKVKEEKKRVKNMKPQLAMEKERMKLEKQRLKLDKQKAKLDL